MNGQTGYAVHCQNLTLGYNRHPAVHHLECQIPSGALLAVVGPNGGGKSTLLKAICGELSPLQGSIALGPNIHNIAYLQQQSTLESSFPVCVFDMVALGLWREIGPFRGLTPAQRQRVSNALTELGLNGLEHRSIGTLSGGQLQRARFARMMLQNADLCLLDEPFNGIDARTCEDLTQLLLHWHTQGRTIIAVLHDLDCVHCHFPLSLLLARDPIMFGPTQQVLTEEQLSHARTLAAQLDASSAICLRSEHDQAA